MKSTFARRMSILLVLAMVLAMLPVAAMAADTATTVYFENNWQWTDVRVHYWGAEESAWPGVAMTDTDVMNGDGTNKIYSAEIPAGCTGILFTGIKNDGSGALDQSPDIADFSSDVIYYMDWADGNLVGSYANNLFGDVEPEVSETTEATEPVEVGTITIYVDAVAANLATPYAWAWGAYGNAFASWPGEAMTLVSGNVYSITVREDTTNIIFSNNGGSQTADLDVAGDNTIWNGTEFVDYSTYTPVGGEVVSYDYYLTGSAELMALAGKSAWDVAAIGLTAVDGIYSYTFSAVPAGDYALKVTNGSWNSTWGGTGADGNYEFTVSTACDVTVSFDGTAITVTGSGIETVTYPPYVVVGNVLGLEDASANWAASNGVEMVDNGDGTYSYTFTALAVSPDAETPYEFKIVKDGTTWLPDGDNWKFYVINEASDVTITIVAETSEISINLGDNVVFDHPDAVPVITPMPEIESVIIVGGAQEGYEQGNFLYGLAWDTTATLNGMTYNTETGKYEATYMGVSAGVYEFKFAINGTWDINFASGLDVVSGETVTAYYNAQGNSILTVEKDNSTITLVLDLSNTVNVGDNAEMTVTIDAPAASVAPDSLVMGDNAYEIADGDFNVVQSTFTATEDCTLNIYVSSMSTYDSYLGEWSEPTSAVGMAFMMGRYMLYINGEQVSGYSSTVEVKTGDVVTVGLAQSMYGGMPAKMTVTLEKVCNHTWTYNYVKATSHTFTCGTCGKVVTATDSDSKKFAFNTAAPTLSDDIVMKIAITLPEGFYSPYMVVDFNGVTTELYDCTYNETNGRYTFAFAGINPQTMGDTFHATLYATLEGVEVSIGLDYSVLKYINSQLKKSTTTDVLRTALSDLVLYGEYNQVYEGYKTDALLSTLLDATATMTPSTYSALDASYNLQKTSGDKDANIDLKGVSLSLGSKLRVKVIVYCADPSAYAVKATINGEDHVYNVSDLALVDGYNDRYVLYFDQIRATQFGELITFTFQDADGNQVGRTLEYSVYTYVQKNQASTDSKLVNLLQAIYNYGEAVKNL